MKVTLTVDFEVSPEKELTSKEISNVTGMLTRVTRNRLSALLSQRLGGDKQSVGWEVTVQALNVAGVSKVR